MAPCPIFSTGSHLAMTDPDQFNSGSSRAGKTGSPVILAEVGTDLRYRWIYNPHDDFDPEAVRGMRDDELDSGPGAQALMDLKRRALEKDQQLREEITFERSDGPQTYDITAIPLRDGPGETVTGLCTAALNVTRRKEEERKRREMEDDLRRQKKRLQEAKAEVEEADRVKTALLSNLNHEIRTPLTSILSFAELINENPEEAGRFADRILGGAKRLLYTLNTVIEFAELEGTSYSVDPALCQLRDVVRAAANGYRERARQKGIEMEVEVSAVQPVQLDAHLTERVLTHLLNNAVKFTKEGTISVLARTAEKESPNAVSR